MACLKPGSFVLLNGTLAVVVGIEGDPDVPEDHVALWYGNSNDNPASENDSKLPIVWTVPTEYCTPVLLSEIRH